MNTEDFNAWAERMGRLRGKKRLSEREIADVLGWARESVSQRLAGTRDVPRYIELACRMAELMERARRG
jgi:transcriptional regulator with XRE-family HTH domain